MATSQFRRCLICGDVARRSPDEPADKFCRECRAHIRHTEATEGYFGRDYGMASDSDLAYWAKRGDDWAAYVLADRRSILGELTAEEATKRTSRRRLSLVDRRSAEKENRDMTSNYPPGVTGAEPQITGECPHEDVGGTGFMEVYTPEGKAVAECVWCGARKDGAVVLANAKKAAAK